MTRLPWYTWCPGWYTVTYDCLKVTYLDVPSSIEVGRLSEEAVIEVVETRRVGGRVRGLILQPFEGWVSLVAEDEQWQWAVPCSFYD